MLGIGLGYSRGGAAAAAEPWFSDAVGQFTSNGTATVTADTLAHTKGAWVEIIASNAANTSALTVYVLGVSQSGTNTATLLDIGVGSSGSESVVAADIAVGGANGIFVTLPLAIASGTRIAARIQSVVTGGKTATVELSTVATGDYAVAPSSVDVLGVVAANSTGTQLGTAGTYYEITASTSQAYRAVAVVASINGVNNNNQDQDVTVAVGAASSETDVHVGYFTEATTEQIASKRNLYHVTGVNVASGSRIAVKHSATTSNLAAVVIGIP